MNRFLEILRLILANTSSAVFDYWFIFVIIIVYFLLKKIYYTNIYNTENVRHPIVCLLEVVLQGIFVGILGSILIVGLGIPIQLSIYLIYLLPISLLLSLFHMRLICISYSAAILGFFSMVVKGIGLDAAGLIAIVAVLHLMEGVLIFFSGAKDCTPIISKKDGQIVQGHIIQKYWPVPFAILFISMGVASVDSIQMPFWWPIFKSVDSGAMYFGLMPFLGVLSYGCVTFTQEPEEKVRKSGLIIIIYSLILIFISYFARDHQALCVIGLLLLGALHEFVSQIEQIFEERKAPIYTLPIQGIRIMDVIDGEAAHLVGIRKGDIIKKINDIVVKDVQHYIELMENKWTFLWIETENLQKQIRVFEIKAYPAGLENLGIRVLPEHPRVLFRYENIKKIGLIDLLKNRFMKK